MVLARTVQYNLRRHHPPLPNKAALISMLVMSPELKHCNLNVYKDAPPWLSMFPIVKPPDSRLRVFRLVSPGISQHDHNQFWNACGTVICGIVPNSRFLPSLDSDRILAVAHFISQAPPTLKFLTLDCPVGKCQSNVCCKRHETQSNCCTSQPHTLIKIYCALHKLGRLVKNSATMDDWHAIANQLI